MQVHGHSDRVTTATALDVTHVIRVQNRVYVTTWPKVAEHERYVHFMQVRCLFVLRADFMFARSQFESEITSLFRPVDCDVGFCVTEATRLHF